MGHRAVRIRIGNIKCPDKALINHLYPFWEGADLIINEKGSLVSIAEWPGHVAVTLAVA